MHHVHCGLLTHILGWHGIQRLPVIQLSSSSNCLDVATSEPLAQDARPVVVVPPAGHPAASAECWCQACLAAAAPERLIPAAWWKHVRGHCIAQESLLAHCMSQHLFEPQAVNGDADGVVQTYKGCCSGCLAMLTTDQARQPASQAISSLMLWHDQIQMFHSICCQLGENCCDAAACVQSQNTLAGLD